MLNSYGDRMIATSGSHGSDIAAQRMDDLDLASLQYVLSHNGTGLRGIDLGCGHGIHGVRLAMLHAHMLLIDTIDQELAMRRLSELLLLQGRLKYHRLDARRLEVREPGTNHFVYSQRLLHYFSYREAKELLQKIKELLVTGGKLFISVSGMLSELGQGYTAQAMPITERTGLLHSDMADKHGIREPVCLYLEDEFRELICRAGFREDQVWTSPFGNIKGIFSRL